MVDVNQSQQNVCSKRIPIQLRNPKYLFVKVKYKEKKPFEKDWQTTANFAYDDPELTKWLENPYNSFGIVCGFGDLLGVDCDAEEFYEKIKPLLPNTFATASSQEGKNRPHLYFTCPSAKSFKVFKTDKYGNVLKDEDGRNITHADVQFKGRQIICPTSTHARGSKYSVVNDAPIAELSKAEWEFIFGPYLPSKQRIKKSRGGRGDTEEIKRRVSISNIMGKYGYDTSKHRMNCKLHTSKSGASVALDEDAGLFHCFGCDAGGDIFNFVMLHDGCDFFTAFSKLEEEAGIREQWENHGVQNSDNEAVSNSKTLKLTQKITVRYEVEGEELTKDLIFHLTRHTLDIYEGDTHLTRFNYSKIDSGILSNIARTLVDLKCHHTQKEARSWLVSNNVFSLLKNLEDNLILQYKLITRNDATKTTLKIDNYMDNVKLFWDRQPFFYDTNKLFWMWSHEDTCWRMVDETDILVAINNELSMMGQLVNSKVKSAYLEAFKQVGRMRKPLDPPMSWIQFKDEIFDYESKEIFPASKDYFMVNPIPWRIGQNSETPTMDKLFTDWVGKKYKPVLYEILAYCTINHYPIHLIFCFVGSGRNGKSQYQKVVLNFVGFKNLTTTELDTLIDRPFESGKLYKKLVCLMGETNFGIMKKTTLLKKISDGSPIGYEFKGKTPFDGVSYATVLINSNSLPSSLDTSDGFYRRWFIIDFPNEFPEGKDIVAQIPTAEYSALAKKVTEIIPDLLDKGQFTLQGDIDHRRLKYIESSNPFPLFLKRCCDRADHNFVSYKELYSNYCKFLKLNKKRKVSLKEFKLVLADEGFFSEKTSKTMDDGFSKIIYWVDGIQMKGNWVDFARFARFPQNLTSSPYREMELKLGQNEQNGQNDTLEVTEEVVT